MADEHRGPGSPLQDDLVAKIGEALASLSPDERQRVVDQLRRLGLDQFGGDPGGAGAFGQPGDAAAFGPGGAGAFGPAASRRRPQRADVVTYRVRVDLAGAKPPLWRRLELASDLSLDEVHEILQAAFGWTDSHLHRFAIGPQPYAPDAEAFVGPYEDEEFGPVVRAAEVRLDEVLAEVGDRAFYVYDYGDDWEHRLKLEAILPRDDAAPRACCTDGRRPGPPEDCGGVHGYELIAAAIDPAHPDHEEATAEFARFYGEEVDPEAFALTPFDLEAINATLAMMGLGRPPAVGGQVPAEGGAGVAEAGEGPAEGGGDAAAGRTAEAGSDAADAGRATDHTAGALPGPVSALLAAVRTAPARTRLRQLITAARLDEPVDIDEDTAVRMVAGYRWLVDHVGDEGITLTGSGYLPPADVRAAFDALGLDDEWIGTGNREHLTIPVLHLRETAQRMGLLRKHRGRLLLTKRARGLRDDPVALWWHLAERMPPRSTDESESQAGLLALLFVAAGAVDDLDAGTTELLSAMGWRSGDGSSLSPMAASSAAFDTMWALRRLGALERRQRSGPEEATAPGVTFSRAALRAWPAD